MIMFSSLLLLLLLLVPNIKLQNGAVLLYTGAAASTQVSSTDVVWARVVVVVVANVESRGWMDGGSLLLRFVSFYLSATSCLARPSVLRLLRRLL